MNDWALIGEYRDFWDVPRIFTISIDGRRLLVDCPFDEESEDYSTDCVVYELDSAFELPQDWRELPTQPGRKLGKVRVSDIKFDESRMKAVTIALFEPFLKPNLV